MGGRLFKRVQEFCKYVITSGEALLKAGLVPSGLDSLCVCVRVCVCVCVCVCLCVCVHEVV